MSPSRIKFFRKPPILGFLLIGFLLVTAGQASASETVSLSYAAYQGPRSFSFQPFDSEGGRLTLIGVTVSFIPTVGVTVLAPSSGQYPIGWAYQLDAEAILSRPSAGINISKSVSYSGGGATSHDNEVVSLSLGPTTLSEQSIYIDSNLDVFKTQSPISFNLSATFTKEFYFRSVNHPEYFLTKLGAEATIEYTSMIVPVPEPSSSTLLVVGSGSVWLLRRVRKTKRL
jgi:hypothetical protein